MNDAQFLSVAWTQLIQVSLLTVSVWLLTKLFARNRPHLAHAMWLVVLAKCVTPPLLASPTGLFGHLSVPEPVWFEPEIVVEEAIEPVVPEPRVDTSNPEFESEITVDPLSQGYVLEDDAMLGQLMFEDSAFELEDEPVESVAAISKPPVAEPSVTFLPLWKLWLISAGTVMSLIFLRVMCTLWRVKRHRTETPPELLELVQKLSKQFGLRRRVRVLITSSRVGPAVVGLFRPLLILPDVVTNGRSAKELEPIVAHELLHVRRGDLGIGCLQVLVQSLWWFHPLIWLVNRLLNRETERCCDEAVLAELNCSPGVYARCLLNVLEQKRNLTPIPAFPGVKPVELTKQRMERIMKLGQGCRKKSPWWCWLVVVLLGAVALPGSAQSQNEDLKPEAQSIETRTSKTEPANAEQVLTPRVYDVHELLETLRKDYEFEPNEAERALEQLVGTSLSSLNVTVNPLMPRAKHDPRQCLCSGVSLFAVNTPEGHQEIKRVLGLWKEHGFYEVKIEGRVTTVPVGFLAIKLPANQKVPVQPRDLNEKPSSTLSSFVLEKAEFRELQELIQGDTRSNLLSFPTITMTHGTSAVVQDLVERPFIADFKGEKFEIEFLKEGLELHLNPLIREGTVTQLDCNVTFSQILKDCNVTFSQMHKDEAKPLHQNLSERRIELSSPVLDSTKVNVSALLEPGQTLMIRGFQKGTGKEAEELIVLLTATATKLNREFLQPVADRQEQATGKLLSGTGVNSEAGVTGSIVLDESNFAWKPVHPASGLPEPAKPWTKKTWAWLKHTPPWKKYDREISVSFDQIPLRHAIEQICAAGDLKFMNFESDKDAFEQISKTGYPEVMCFENDLVYDLAEEPISLSVPVTFLAEKKAAIPILEEILKPYGLGLGHLDGLSGKPGGCFEIRTKDFLDHARWTIIYPVGDLLEKDQSLHAGPTRGVPVLDKIPHQEKLFKPKTKADVADVLIEVLENELGWDNSEANTANGTMKFRESSEALVIQCDRAQHDLIAEWLCERRKSCGIEFEPVLSNPDVAVPRMKYIDHAHARSNVDPELGQILVQWEQANSRYQRLSGEHHRFVYDAVSQVEKRSEGTLYYEAPDKWRINLNPVKIESGAKSQKLAPQGKAYSVKSDGPEIWIRDGKQIAQAKGVPEKIYTVYNIPEKIRTGGLVDNVTRLSMLGPAGEFLCGLSAQEAVERYHFILLPNTNENQVWMEVLPKRAEDKRNWKQSQVILDRKTFLPLAIKWIDPAGTTETVYRFENFKVNRNADKDAFNIPVVLKEYELVSPIKAEAEIDAVQLRFQGPEKFSLIINRYEVSQEFTSLHALPTRQSFRAGGRSFRLTFQDTPERIVKSDWPVPYWASRRNYSWTLDIPEITEQSRKYLSHNAVPVALTDEDLNQIDAGNLVTKVVYLPLPDTQELAIANLETIVSTRLDPGVDPIEAANRRGTIVAVMRSARIGKSPVYGNSTTRPAYGIWPYAIPHPWTPRTLNWEDGAWKLDFSSDPTDSPERRGVQEATRKSAAHKTDDQNARVIAKVYPVADLVVPIPGTESDHVKDDPSLSKLPDQSKLFKAKKKPLSESAQPLIDLIRKSIEPESWSGEKAVGTIAFHEEKLSLVIRHKESVHQKISELLTTLRRKQDLQVTLECLTVQFEKNSFSDFWTNVGIEIEHLDANAKNSMKPLIFHGVKRDDFRSKIDQFEAAQVLSFPKVTVFNGVGAQIQISGAGADEESVPMMHYMIVPTISEDRRTIDVKFAVNPANTLDALTKAKSMTISDGKSVLIEVTDELLSGQKRTGVPEVDKALRELKKKELGLRTFVLLTPRIIIQEEEEELLNRVEPKGPVITVAPRIIIQEEEEELLRIPQLEAKGKE